jgi:hypothetical protein
MKTYGGRTANGVSDSTRESYADAITRVAIPFFGTTRLDHIDAPMLRDSSPTLPRSRARDGKGNFYEDGRTISPDTVRRYYAPVRALLATAYEDGLLPTNPAQASASSCATTD